MSISRWRTPAVAPWSTPSPSARRRWGLRLCLQSIAPPPLPRTAGCSHAQCCSLMRPATTCKRRGWPLAPPSLYIPVHSNAEGEPFKIYRVPVLFLNDRFTFGFLLGTGSSPLLHFPQPSVESFPRHLTCFSWIPNFSRTYPNTSTGQMEVNIYVCYITFGNRKSRQACRG